MNYSNNLPFSNSEESKYFQKRTARSEEKKVQSSGSKNYIMEAEKAFLDYFLSKVAPSKESEKRRNDIFDKIKNLVHNAFRNTHLPQLNSNIAETS
jgi:DNA polymerase sigma